MADAIRYALYSFITANISFWRHLCKNSYWQDTLKPI
jgi:hypothetical protein